MKLLITKNKYGISARISDKEDKKISYFLPVTLSEENEKKFEENKAYLLSVKDSFFKVFPKKDGTTGLKLCITDFEVEKTYENNTQTSTQTTLKPIDEDEILPF